MSETSEVRSAKVEVGLAYEQRADAAAAAVSRALLDVVREDLPGSVAGEESEFLHQLRIAVRRTRTVQRQLRGVFDGLELPGYRSDFRWLQRATGPARDLDVYLDDFGELTALAPEPARGDLGPLRDVLAARRERAHAQLVVSLHSPRTAELLGDWEQLLETLVEQPLDDRPDARRSIGSLSGERIVGVYERIVRDGERIDGSSPAEAYHGLRKRSKELRYTLDLFGARLFDADAVSELLRSVKELQELLGRHQDREVQVQMLRALVPDVAATPGGSPALMAMGALSGRLREDELAARAEFGERFAAFAAPERRERVREIFA